MPINRENVRKLLQTFDFRPLFIEEMGWSRVPSSRPVSMAVNGTEFTRTPIAQMSGVMVFEVAPVDGQARIPDSKTRATIHKEVEGLAHENLLIFVDNPQRDARTQSLWYWVKREGNKKRPREHVYLKGQPGDLFLSKLDSMVIELDELREDGTIPITEVTSRLATSLDIERVTKRFYNEFSLLRVEFIDLIEGIDREADRFWYASVLLNRLMFVYFLQKKGFIQNNARYLDEKLHESERRGENRYYSEFLKTLFFEGFAKPENQRSAEARALLGPIKYLNGGLFLPHQLEQSYQSIRISDIAFENVLDLFGRYSWHLDDTPGASDNEINPDVLGYIFEKYINQKAFGAYYTRTEITQYLCESTINAVIVEKVNEVSQRQYTDIGDILLRLDAELCRKLLDILPRLSILDPACGSGAFLVAAMKTMLDIYAAVFGKIEFLTDTNLTKQLRDVRREHPSVNYYIRKRIITDNLYGVDIMEEAAEIARLRLFLFLVSSAQTVDQLEPLPNIDFNIMCGNSLVGLLKVDETRFDNRNKMQDMFQGEKARQYRELLAEKDRLVSTYRYASTLTDNLESLRSLIDDHHKQAYCILNDILLDDFRTLGIQYEQAQQSGRAKKRPLEVVDVEQLTPFHWGYEFDEIISVRGGFDVVITNPPWEIFKPSAKEFLAEYSDLVSKKKMDIKQFEAEQAKLLKDPEINAAWLEYLSRYPYVSAYFRSAPQFSNQISLLNGKKAGTDINLYKLFVEQCYNLLRRGGQCGIVIPSGIYTDLGAKQLREMLFTASQLRTLFGLSNEKFIFEGVHHAFKIAILTFRKSGKTVRFEAAFRINPREAIAANSLESFLNSSSEHISIDVPLVRDLSPDALSIPEFKDELDITISRKALKFPALGDDIAGIWKLDLTREFDISSDNRLFHKERGPNMLPLYEGKMINQYTHKWGEQEPRFWLDPKTTRQSLLGKAQDVGQMLGYQSYRLAVRRVASATNVRTLITTILPQNVFAADSFHVSIANGISDKELLVACSLLNSLVVDFLIRQKVSANISLHFIYDLHVPRLSARDRFFNALVQRSAKLICTTPEFDDLARAAGLASHKDGVLNESQRNLLRAEIDGMIAHIYELTEQELTHLLSTFPLVPEPTKVAVQNAYRDVERGLIE